MGASGRLLAASQHIEPLWFSVSMGTGILASTFYSLPYSFSGKEFISIILFFVNLAVFCVLLTGFLLRCVIHSQSLHELFAPDGIQQLVYLGTIPIAVGSLVTDLSVIIVPHTAGWAATTAWVLRWIEVGLAVLSCSVLAALILGRGHIELSHMRASWLLPFISAIVVATSGSDVATALAPRDSLIVIYVLCNAGCGLWHL